MSSKGTLTFAFKLFDGLDEVIAPSLKVDWPQTLITSTKHLHGDAD